MKLYFNKTGAGQPLIILHGLFGSGDNWTTFARSIASHGFCVYMTDLRNHGRSGWSDEHNYSVMAADVMELIHAEQLQHVVVLGHSMGGKVTMQLAVDFPDAVEKIIVADIGPQHYGPHHQQILQGLLSLDFSKIKSRGEADEQLALYIEDTGTRQFLLKSLYWKTDTELALRFNLEVLNKKIEEVGKEITSSQPISVPALFIAGEKSNYLKPDDEQDIRLLFPNSEIIFIPGAGHWIHADQPALLMEAVLKFLKRKEA
jgi:esterase